MYTVFGAGSVGTVLAALLARAGVPVSIAGRGAVPDLRAEGDLETVVARVPVVQEPRGTILLCVHEPDVGPLCARWGGRTVVTFQNGVASEEVAARHCRVIGGVWRMTCMLAAPGRALFTRPGGVAVGRHPSGIDDEVRALGADLARAGLRVELREEIAQAKWLKLLVNLASVVNALVRDEDHPDPRFSGLKADLMEEAVPLLRGTPLVEEEARAEIDRMRRGPGGRARPVRNSTWRQLSLGRRPAQRFHDLVTARGNAPLNAAMLRLLDDAPGPGCYRLSEVLAALS